MMHDWFGIQARRAARERRSGERALARGALVDVATRTPFLRKGDTSGTGPDSSFRVAEILVDSGPLITSLDALAHGLVDPNAPFVGPLIEAARDVRRLEEMLPAWIRHCEEHSPAPADPDRDAGLRYVDGLAMRTWSRAEEAKEAAERAERSIRQLYPLLAGFYGFDITAGRGAA